MAVRILIVEDEADAARDLREKAEELGYVVAADTDEGEDACRLAAAHTPDVVLMDIRLRGAMDGLEAARIIEERHSIPVVVVTQHIDDERIRGANEAGVAAVLHKPVHTDDLRAAIEIAVHRESERLRSVRELDERDRLRSTLRGWAQEGRRKGAADVETVSAEILGRVVDALQPLTATLYQLAGNSFAPVATLARDAGGRPQVELVDSTGTGSASIEPIVERAARAQSPVIEGHTVAVPLMRGDTTIAVLSVQAQATQTGIKRWAQNVADFAELGSQFLCDARLNNDIDDHLSELHGLLHLEETAGDTGATEGRPDDEDQADPPDPPVR